VVLWNGRHLTQAIPGYAFTICNRMPSTRTRGESGRMAAGIEATHSDWGNECGEHLRPSVDERVLPPILSRMLDASQVLSRYGTGRVNRIQAKHRPPGLSRGWANPSSSLRRATSPSGFPGATPTGLGRPEYPSTTP
jgi:hypothetical protein